MPLGLLSSAEPRPIGIVKESVSFVQRRIAPVPPSLLPPLGPSHCHANAARVSLIWTKSQTAGGGAGIEKLRREL